MPTSVVDDEDMGSQIELSDETTVGPYTWRQLKEDAMKPDYQNQDFYSNILNFDERCLLDALITAQKNQGDMNELTPQPYREIDDEEAKI